MYTLVFLHVYILIFIEEMAQLTNSYIDLFISVINFSAVHTATAWNFLSFLIKEMQGSE